MKNQIRFSRLLVAALLALSVISFIAAAFHFLSAIALINAYARLLEENEKRPISHLPPSIGFQTMVFNTLRELQTTGIVLTATAIGCAVLALSFHRRFKTVAMIAIILFTIAFVPKGWSLGPRGSGAEKTRWYVYTELQNPEYAIASSFKIVPRTDYVVYPKENLTVPPYSFVGFWVNLERGIFIYPTLYREYIQTGFFKNSSGLFLYCEIQTINPPPDDYYLYTYEMPEYYIEQRLQFAIFEYPLPDHFYAVVQEMASGDTVGDLSIPIEPEPGHTILGELTFQVTGVRNWFRASSESNNPENYIPATRLSDIGYYYNGEQFWSDIEKGQDFPYHMTSISTHEFAVYGGSLGGTLSVKNCHRRGGYIAVQIGDIH